MWTHHRTVLITGGATGIGFALAERFFAAGNRVIICGRREDRLRAAAEHLPGISTIRCDLTSELERCRLFEAVTSAHPKIDILVNNAGIQNRPPPIIETHPWRAHKEELATNLEAPIHLSMLFIKHLATQPQAAIMNVSSGLAFAPLGFMPTYCATKAALHSFTQSLRYQLRHTSVRVVEIIPPKVNTDLGGVGLHDDGAPVGQFADHVWRELLAGSLEIGYEFSERARLAAHAALGPIFTALNQGG